jgi:hypothetical protein
MPTEELRKALTSLHDELGRNPQLDASTQQAMRSILDEIQSTLARSSLPESQPAARESERGEVETDSSLTQRVRDLITDFEIRHPQLTSTLSQIADRLADMGI